MENLWKLIEKSEVVLELHALAADAKAELHALADRIEEFEKEGDSYVPDEYPKMLAIGKTVWNAAEEAAATPVAPVATESQVKSNPVTITVVEPEVVAVPAVAVGEETAPEPPLAVEPEASPTEETAP